jgi:hypothetical protein
VVGDHRSSGYSGESADFQQFQQPSGRRQPPGGRDQIRTEVIKTVCAERLSPAEVERIRSAGKNIELRMLTDRSELKNHAAIRSIRKR